MAWGGELTLLGWELSPQPFLPVGTLSPVPQRVNSLCLVGNVRIGAGFGCGRPGSLCVVQTAVLGCRAAGEKSWAAGNALNPAKRFCGVFCTPLPLFCLSTFVSLL